MRARARVPQGHVQVHLAAGIDGDRRRRLPRALELVGYRQTAPYVGLLVGAAPAYGLSRLAQRFFGANIMQFFTDRIRVAVFENVSQSELIRV